MVWQVGTLKNKKTRTHIEGKVQSLGVQNI